MPVHLSFTFTELTPLLTQNKIVIMLDVFRASTTIITALSQGAHKIIPLTNPAKALQLKKANPQLVLGGEKNGKKIAGFDLGNSPLEYTPGIINKKTVILSTTNGIPALNKIKNAQRIYIGSFLNAPFLIKKILPTNHKILLVCAGTRGEYSLEDTCCAGYFLHLFPEKFTPYFSDQAFAALALYHQYQNDLPFYLCRSRNGRQLLTSGKWSEITYCCLRGLFPVLPIYENAVIRREA